LASIGGCSGASVPSERTGRAVFIDVETESLKELKLKLKSFRKTNGQQAVVMGVKVYTLEWEVKLEPIAGGDVITQRGWYTFQQTETGWRCDENGKVY
jgi:hypothetical protein